MSGYVQIPALASPVVCEDDRPPVPILLVDDDEMKRFALKRLLEPLGYQVVEADSGPAALRCVLAQDFALILLDVRMPGMDGFETAALLRTRARSSLTPILLSTASTRGELTASGLYGAGVAQLMLAPVEPEELRATVAVFADLFLKAQQNAVRAHEVQAEADRYRLLSTAAPVGLFQTDRDHRYTYTNPCWSRLTGIRPEAALAQDWRTTEPLSSTGTEVGAAIARGEDLVRRIELPGVGSTAKVALLRAHPIHDPRGSPAGWVGALSELTALVPPA